MDGTLTPDLLPEVSPYVVSDRGFLSPGPLFPRVFWIWQFSASGVAGQPAPGFSVDYTWSFNVTELPPHEPVAEPATSALMVFGIVVAALKKRQRLRSKTAITAAQR